MSTLQAREEDEIDFDIHNPEEVQQEEGNN